MSTTSNITRKVKALLAKTVANGCTDDGATSALQIAKDIVAKHDLDPAKFEWPPAPVATAETKPKHQPKASGDKPKKVKRPDRLMELISRDIGVSIPELMGEFGILPHTARAYISVVTRARGAKAVLQHGRYHLAYAGDHHGGRHRGCRTASPASRPLGTGWPPRSTANGDR